MNAPLEFLSLSLHRHRPVVIEALKAKNFARSVVLEFDVQGLPEIDRVTLVATAFPPGHPDTVRLDVVRLGDTVLEEPKTLDFALVGAARCEETPPVEIDAQEAFDEEEILRVDGLVWYIVEPDGIERQVRRLDARGHPMFEDVDTTTFGYRLVCPLCGRVRYATKNNLQQIRSCWVCSRADWSRRKHLSEYQRRPRSGRTAKKNAVRLKLKKLQATGQYTQREMAQLCGVSPSWASKLLKPC